MKMAARDWQHSASALRVTAAFGRAGTPPEPPQVHQSETPQTPSAAENSTRRSRRRNSQREQRKVTEVEHTRLGSTSHLHPTRYVDGDLTQRNRRRASVASVDSRAIEESRTALNSFISACEDSPETQPNTTAVGGLVRRAASDIGKQSETPRPSAIRRQCATARRTETGSVTERSRRRPTVSAANTGHLTHRGRRRNTVANDGASVSEGRRIEANRIDRDFPKEVQMPVPPDQRPGRRRFADTTVFSGSRLSARMKRESMGPGRAVRLREAMGPGFVGISQTEFNRYLHSRA